MKRKVEAQLIAWKNKSSERQPLLVNGARQVGKTYILRKFGEEQFKNVVYVNLETNLTIASYFNDNIFVRKLRNFTLQRRAAYWVSPSTDSTILFPWERLKRSPCILWILRNTYGLVVRSSLLLKYVPPLRR